MKKVINYKVQKEELEEADVIISKGQGNFETLYGCGLNVYYLYPHHDELHSYLYINLLPVRSRIS